MTLCALYYVLSTIIILSTNVVATSICDYYIERVCMLFIYLFWIFHIQNFSL